MPTRWPDNWPSELRVVLALTPHPDDELFCASLLARAARAGARVEVACATAGQRGMIFGASADPDEVAALRSGELAASCAALGVAAVHELGFADGDLDDRAATAIAAAIDRAGADLIVSYGDEGGYGHRDHVALARMIEARLAALPSPPRWLRSGFPPGAFASLARRIPAELLAPGVDTGGVNATSIDWIVDCSPTAEVRRAAIDAHASQRWMLDQLPALRSAEEWYLERRPDKSLSRRSEAATAE